tara:strand:- start:55 stop:738 length:684 start_codon:yes stop_codon:yes gene_type:complete
MRSRPDREDYFFIASLIAVLTLFWLAYAYQACFTKGHCLLDTLKEWQTLLTGILTLFGAILAGWVALRVAGRQIQAATEQYYDTIRPFVVVRLNTHAGVVFMLEIENIGQSAAANLVLKLDKDFFAFGDGHNLREASAFTRPFAHFAPKEKLSFYLSQGFNMENKRDGIDRTPSVFTVSATYGFRDKKYEESYVIDTTPYDGVAALKKTEDYLSDIAKSVHELAKRR